MVRAPRLALQYVLLFGANGVSLPFAGVWLRAQGLDGAQIGAILAAPMLARLVTGPAIAVWADGLKARRSAIAVTGLIAALGYAAAGLADGFLARALAWFVGATAAAALPPLIDVLNLKLARRDGYSFASPRGWGSAAFVAANLIMGALLTRTEPGVVVIWIVAASAIGAFTAWKVLPPEPTAAGAGPGMERIRGLGRLIANPALMTALVAVGCVQATHAFYYGFSALIWRGQGISEATVGALWAASVVIEIGFMWWIHPWLRRRGIGPRALLLIGSAAAVTRWGVLALAPPLAVLWPLQVLHALTFAATYLASVELVERLAPPDGHTAAQTLNSALSSGVLIGVATAVSGPLFDAVGPRGYLAMAALAAVGGVAALAVRSNPAPRPGS